MAKIQSCTCKSMAASESANDGRGKSMDAAMVNDDDFARAVARTLVAMLLISSALSYLAEVVATW